MKRVTGILAAALMLLAASSCGKKYEYPFQNPRLSTDERVENLLSLLTPDEKIGLMMNGSISVDRLGIPYYNWWSEACHGICYDDVTVYPQSIALAATFDPEQQYEIYTTVSDEARAVWNTTDHNEFGHDKPNGGIWHQGLTFWCPNVNIFRDPRWGRGQETSGEDPWLAGVMGTQTVKGMQGSDPKYFKTHSCAKHYAVHSGPEPLRHQFNASVSQRDLWETYLPHFKMLVQEGNVQEVMCAYNRYEGEPCCGSDRLLQDILRNKWGYKSMVVSDCDAIGDFFRKGQHEVYETEAEASAAGVLAGTDVECGTHYTSLKEALDKGLISEADLDVSVRRLLRSRFELGMFDPEENLPWAGLGKDDLASPEHTALALKAARECMTLLKNDGILPLSKDIKKIAVVGPNADNASMHNGNYNGIPTKENTVSIVEAIRRAAPGVEVVYDPVCELVDSHLTTQLLGTMNGGKGAHIEFYNNPSFEGEPDVVDDFQTVNMYTYGEYQFAPGVNKNNISLRLTGKFTADYTGELFYNLRASDPYKFVVNGRTVAEQTERPMGMRRAFAAAPRTSIKVQEGKEYDIELSFSNAAEGFSFITFELCRRDLPDYGAAAKMAADCDAVIVVGGLSSRLEGEQMPVNFDGFNGGDRTRIELPVVQEKLLRAMRATGKPVVLVNCSGSAIGFGNVEDQYDALLQAWYGGQAAGLAVADVLFGDYNPAGRLPVTFYASTSQLPDFLDYNMEGHTYRYFRGTPLYAFGYGLSYTSFEYGQARLSAASAAVGSEVTVTIPVRNTGERDGEEVVQVYVKALGDPGAPIKSLKGFKRIGIAAGGEAEVEIVLDKRAFEFYDESIDELSPRAGKYLILYGGSSRDEDLKPLEFEYM